MSFWNSNRATVSLSLYVCVTYLSCQWQVHIYGVDATLRNKTLWIVVCMSVYFFSISGVVFDILRDVPFWREEGMSITVRVRVG